MHLRRPALRTRAASLLILFFSCEVVSICEYGALPGTMLPSTTAPFSLTWTIYDKDCQLKDELTPLIGPPPWTFMNSQNPGVAPYLVWAKDARTKLMSNIGPQVKVSWDTAPKWRNSGDPLRILYFGDSTDAAQIVDFCKEAELRRLGVHAYGFGRNCPACSFPNGLQLLEQFIPGVWPSGPYLDHYTDADAPQKNIPKGFQNLLTATGDMRPNILIFNGLLWDIGRLHVQNQTLHSMEFLSKEFVLTYMDLLDKFLTYVESSVPAETLLVYHNAAYPRLQNCHMNDRMAHEPIGQMSHVMQLNAGGRQVVSKRARWHLLDYGQMSEATMLDFAHLRDGLHPNAQFTAQAFNIVLNLYRDHQMEHAKAL